MTKHLDLHIECCVDCPFIRETPDHWYYCEDTGTTISNIHKISSCCELPEAGKTIYLKDLK
jgi:hypothetical protein